MNAPGYNPLRYNCQLEGCFNQKKRPKIEIFSECFPRKISFGDIDGHVELVWNFLYLEWKPSPVTFNFGAKLSFERRTCRGESTVLCVAGNAETMQVTHMGLFWHGKFHGWEDATLEDVKSKIRSWAMWAQRHPAFPGPCPPVGSKDAGANRIKAPPGGAAIVQSRS